MIVLPGPVRCRYDRPIVAYVDPTIFTKQYYAACLACTFCRDACCRYGVDVDLVHQASIEARADAIEAYVGVPRDRWFAGEITPDPEMPGGGTVRTQVENGACVFRNRMGSARGCALHAFCTDFGLDYHDYKSIVDCLFPLSVVDQTLCPADEVDDGSLVCAGVGPTLYRALRHELDYYFGADFVTTLDQYEPPDVDPSAGR